MVVYWIQLVLGLWILVSPWVLDFSSISIMKWSNVIVGLCIVLMNVWVIFGGKEVEKTNDGQLSKQ
jgi:hypothetical protein